MFAAVHESGYGTQRPRAGECLFMGEKRSCSGHHRNDRFRPAAVTSPVGISQHSSLLPDRGMLFFRGAGYADARLIMTS